MSERNGDRARFQTSRRRKLRRRQRLQELLRALRERLTTTLEKGVGVKNVTLADEGR